MQFLRVKWLAPVWVAGLLVHSQINHLDAGEAGNGEGRRGRGRPLARRQPGDGAERSRERDYENIVVGHREDPLYMNVPKTRLSTQLFTGSHVNGERSHESRTAGEPVYEEVRIALPEASTRPSNSVGNAQRHFNPYALLGLPASDTQEDSSPDDFSGRPTEFLKGPSEAESVYENVPRIGAHGGFQVPPVGTKHGHEGTSPVSPISPTYTSYVGGLGGDESSQERGSVHESNESSPEPVYAEVRATNGPGWQRGANGVSGTREGVRQPENGTVYTEVRAGVHSAGRPATTLQMWPEQHSGKPADEGDYEVLPVPGAGEEEIYGLVGIARGNRSGAEHAEERDYEELPLRGAGEYCGQGECDGIYGSVGIARGRRVGGFVADVQNQRGNDGIYEELPPPHRPGVPVHSPPLHSTTRYPNVQTENPAQPNLSANVSARSGVQSLQVNPEQSLSDRFKSLFKKKPGKQARKL